MSMMLSLRNDLQGEQDLSADPGIDRAATVSAGWFALLEATRDMGSWMKCHTMR